MRELSLLFVAGLASIALTQDGSTYQNLNSPVLKDDIDPDSTLLTLISLLPQNRTDRQEISGSVVSQPGMDRPGPGPRPRPRPGPGPRPRPGPRPFPPRDRCGNWSEWQNLKCWWPSMDMKSLPEACRYIPMKSQWPDYLKKFVEAKATEIYTVIQTEYKKRGAPPKCGFCSKSFQCRMRNATNEDDSSMDYDGSDNGMGRGRGGGGGRRRPQCPLKEIRPLAHEDCDDAKACEISLEDGGCRAPLFLGGGRITKIQGMIDQGDDEGVMNEIYNTQFDDPTSAMDSDFTDYTLLGRKKSQADFGNYDDSSFGDAGASPQYDWSGSNSGRAGKSFGMGGVGQGSQSYPGMRQGGQDRFGSQQSGPQGGMGGFSGRGQRQSFGPDSQDFGPPSQFGPDQGSQRFGPSGRGQGFGPDQGGRGSGPNQGGRGFGPDQGGRGFGPDQGGRGSGPGQGGRGSGPGQGGRGSGPGQGGRGFDPDFGPGQGRSGFGPSGRGRGFGPDRQGPGGRQGFGPDRQGPGGFGPRQGDDPWYDDSYDDDWGSDDGDDYDMGDYGRFGPGGRGGRGGGGRGRFPPRPFGPGGRGRFPPRRWDPRGRGRHGWYPPPPSHRRHHFGPRPFGPGGRDRRHRHFPPPPPFGPHRRHHRGGRGPWGDEDSSFENSGDFGGFGQNRMSRQDGQSSDPMFFAVFTPAFMNSTENSQMGPDSQMGPGRGGRGGDDRRGKMDFMANLLKGTTCVSNGKSCLCCCGHYIPNVDTGNCQSLIGMLPGIDGVLDRLATNMDDSDSSNSLTQFSDAPSAFKK